MTEVDVVEMTQEEAEANLKKGISTPTSTRIKYAIAGLCWFLAMPLAFLGVIFEPLYKRVYYGQAMDYFKYGIAIILMVVFFFLNLFVFEKKVLKLEYKRDKSRMSWKMLSILFFGSFIIAFIVSVINGFELKIFHDVGNNTAAYKMGQKFARFVYQYLCLFNAMMMIKNFQYALDDLIPIHNKNVAKYIPYGGIVTLLTYGIYGLCTGVGASLSVLWFFLILLYGEIFILCKRNVLKAYPFCLLIFIL